MLEDLLELVLYYLVGIFFLENLSFVVLFKHRFLIYTEKRKLIGINKNPVLAIII